MLIKILSKNYTTIVNIVSKQEQMIKQSTILQRQQCNHLLYMNNHHKSLGNFRPLYNRMSAQVLVKAKVDIYYSISMNLPLNWYQTEEFQGAYHHTRFERIG